MLRDVFYFGNKPNVHPREKSARDLADARSQSTTSHFWIINEFCDYRGFEWDFDFEFLPDDEVWTEYHNNVWPSQHQKDSGTWLCPKEYSNVIVYRTETPVKRKNVKTDNWVMLDTVDESKFDFSWHPDPTDPPYIYKWGCKFYPAQIKHVLEYRVPGATATKYMTDTVELLPTDYWLEYYPVDKEHFDFTWRPDPMDPPFIYVWGNKHFSGKVAPTLTYHVPGATQHKHLTTTVELVSDPSQFEHLEDSYGIDYTWTPDPSSPPYIYVWGNQWNKATDKASIQYTVPGATEYKYMEQTAIRRPCMDNWLIPDNVDVSDFDFSWEPSPADPAFIYEFGTQWQKTGGPQYIVPGATKIKYVDTLKAKALPSSECWEILEDIDLDAFDFSWHPDSSAPPYIYVWGNQWNKSTDKVSVRYVVPGATDIKHTGLNATRKPCMDNWLIPENIDVSDFDFSWEPSPADPAFIYEFGTQWQKTDGPLYIVPGATKKKYIDVLKAKALPTTEHWSTDSIVDIKSFDYSWHPDSTEDPYIYMFGTQWQSIGGPRYVMPGATVTKYIDPSVVHAVANATKTNWIVPDDIDESSFDFSWHPHPEDPDYVYQFGTQWQKTGGPRYVSDMKYVDDLPIKYVNRDILHAVKRPTTKNWDIPAEYQVELFDFSWHPDDTDPPYVYQFGTVLENVHLKDGPRYVTPGNDGEVILRENILFVEPAVKKEVARYYIKTTFEDLLAEHKNEVFWALRENIDYSKFNFDWLPSLEESYNISVFGSTESELTQTYFVDANNYFKGYTGRTYVDDTKLDELNLSELFVRPNMFFVDRSNPEAQARFDKLKAKYPDIQKTRFLNTWVDTIKRCVNRSSTDLCWILNSELDYTDFDFNYYPNPWQMKMVHVFGTQWSHWGTTFIVNRETFANDTKYIKIIEHLSNLNFVKDEAKKAKATDCLYDVFVIDFGNSEMFKVLRTLQHKVGNRPLVDVEYAGNYLDTFKEILKQCPTGKKDHYVWICSSICDYTNFDFSYISDPFALDQLHVFPSDGQKYGDTFLVNVNQLRELVDGMESLSDYDWLNNRIDFSQRQRVSRYPAPVIVSEDTHTTTISTNFDYPYAVFVTADNKDIAAPQYEPSYWNNETKNIIVTSTGATQIIVPKEVSGVVNKELYDYPYIIKSDRLLKSKPLDIVFLSNGEPCADENYEHLLNVTNGLPNRIVRVDGVNGRVAAYHAAADASESPWMFTVFAKLKVSNKFDWNWQPDRLQVPKHYVFHAKNPLNGLVYGHQAMIAYNKKMTLANTGRGLDFTQDDVHEVIPLNSGTAVFNSDSWTTWRTAFREALKLCTYPDEISQERLNTWTTVANGDFASYCLDGANDAVAYFDEVAGDYDALKLSYDWAWLKDRFDKKY